MCYNSGSIYGGGECVVYGDRHPGKIRTAEILCVGTELLLGDIVNTDAAFLSRRLAELGIAVYRQSVVGDSPERLRMALTEAFAGHGGAPADLVILSGGLGNMIDRVRMGYVVDYIYLSFFPAIFNFADCCVVAGAILAVLGFLIAERRTAKAKAAEAPHE